MKYHRLALTAILLAALFLLTYQITLPYGKVLEHGTLEIRARNFLQEGFLPLRFLPTRNLIGGKPNFYLNHPPLFLNYLALVLKIFGDSEVTARSAVIALSLGSIYLLYLIVCRETSARTAIWTVLIAILLPIFFYYGRIVNYEPAALFLSLLTIWLYLKSSAGNSLYLRAALLGTVVLGVLCSWAFYFTPLALFCYALLRRQNILPALGALIAGGATFVIMLGVYVFAAQRWGGSLTVCKEIGEYFSVNPTKRTVLWLTQPFYKALAERSLRGFTGVTLLLAAGGLILNLINFRQFEYRRTIPLTILFLVSGAGLIIVAPKDVYHHDWGLFMLIPAIAFLSAQLLLKLRALIRITAISALILFSAIGFRNFHGPHSFSPRRIGEMIRDNSQPGDILLALRGNPLIYYAGIPIQFHWPGPPSVNVIRRIRPAWVVLQADGEMYLLNTVEEIYNCLKEEGYQLIKRDNYLIYRRGDLPPPASDLSQR